MKSSVFESKAFQSRSKGKIPGQTRRKEWLSRSKLKQAFLIDSDAELFMYLIQCIRFGSWKLRHLNRALRSKPTNLSSKNVWQPLLFISPNESNKPTQQTINFWFGENVVYTIFKANAWRGVLADNFPVVLIFQKKTYKERLLCYHLLLIFETLLQLSLHLCQFTCTLWNLVKKKFLSFF